MKRKLGYPTILLVCLLGFFASTAKADQFTISTPNAGLSGTPGPYATVTLTLVTINQGSTICTSGAPCVHVNVTMLGSPQFSMFGNGTGNGAFGMNYSGNVAGLTISNLTSGFAWDGGGGQFDGFGLFNIAITDGQPSDFHHVLDFTISKTGGFSSLSSVEIANSLGVSFVVHVAPGGNAQTGFAGNSTPTPEPMSMLLLGSGLIGLATRLRQRKPK